jgi:hypothetical protein
LSEQPPASVRRSAGLIDGDYLDRTHGWQAEQAAPAG